jgi:tetratricopeptide (TPR) repeat protein
MLELGVQSAGKNYSVARQRLSGSRFSVQVWGILGKGLVTLLVHRYGGLASGKLGLGHFENLKTMILSPRLTIGPALLLCLAAAEFLTPQAWAGPVSLGTRPPEASLRPSDPLNASAFDHYYNLDYDRAVEEFDQVLRRHPNDPFAVNHVMTAILIRELYRMGAMNTGEYANDSFIGQAHRPADPKVKEQIKSLVQRAENLEEQELKSNPNDADAIYARGVTRAEFSIYTALIERAWFSALRNAVGARRDHERVLELDPNYVDAKLVVGTHYYVLGSLPWGVKVAVAMVGLSGSKDKGIQHLYDVAKGNGENSIDAQVVLSLFLRREHRYDEALGIMRGLIPLYPRNVLLALEEGNLLRDSGRNQEAAVVYRKIWQAGREGHYAGLHYEVTALSLGDLLRGQKDYGGAATAYEGVSELAQPDPEVLQKADLGAGEMYDLLQKHDLAIKKYEAVIAAGENTAVAETAREHMKEPYRGE